MTVRNSASTENGLANTNDGSAFLYGDFKVA